MPENSHLFPQLDAYLNLERPGFALMIDAPWGAGKTHLVRQWLVHKDHLFVSLYGAASREDIERAIVMARLNAMDNGTARALATVIGAGIEVAAGYLGVSKPQGLQKIALAALPKLLVFDDLERTEGIPVHSLLGMLNRYVEHEERHVILLANQNELRVGCEDYDRVREKVIGRVIAIAPDDKDALAAFLNGLTSWNAHAFLMAEEDVILSVFRNSECQNLRLLRQALMEYARFHDMIPQDLLDQTEPMRYVLATFVALTVSFHEGKGFGLADLGQEGGGEFANLFSNKDKTDKQLKGIGLVRDRNGDSQYVRLYGTVLSPSLAQSFIGRGHADCELIERELRAASIFTDASPEDWQTLWRWRSNDVAEVQAALASVRDKLASHAETDPRMILHITGIFLDLSKHGIIPENNGKIVASMEQYINGLRQSNLLVADTPVQYWDSHFRHEAAFGLAYSERETSEFQKIKSALMSAIDDAFWDRSPRLGGEILEWARTNPKDFLASLDRSSRREGLVSYAGIPILANADPVRAAELFSDLVPQQAQDVLELFEGRINYLAAQNHDGSNTHWPDEGAWLLRVRDGIMAIAADTDEPIRKAQLNALIEWRLKFLDPEKPEGA